MTDAEIAVDLARTIRHMPSRLVFVTESMDSAAFSRIRTALMLSDRGPAIQLRAVMEDWSWERIVREVF